MYQPIEDYGVVGDLHTVALIGMNGSVDFMCYPEFDSPSVFAALLDDERGGRFELAPRLENARRKQLYLPDSNILVTRFLSHDGVAEITDFMTLDECDCAHALVRRVKTVRGELRFRMRCAPRFDYARGEHTVRAVDNGVVFEPRTRHTRTLRLASDQPLRIDEGDAVCEFTLGANQHACFILCQDETGDALGDGVDQFAIEQFKETLNYWRKWVSQSLYRGRWRETVNRSALALKLLTSRRYGAIVAAPTFGLPETLGGVRNWDYRYTWIRDASFTLYGLMRLGFTQEAKHFMQWIEERCDELAPDGSLQIMYAIDGHHQLHEEELKHFEGYRGSRPVRVGNGAFDQLQLDIYGELMDSVYLYNKYGEPISHDLWNNLVRLVNWVCANWQRKDDGIWEVRGGAQHFLYSRLMCWVAIDRGLRLADKRSFPAPRAKWFETRDTIYRDIFKHFWNDELKAFRQTDYGDSLDAAVLLMPLVKFISPTDPRWLSTLEAIQSQLVDDSLVYRYRADRAAPDGLHGIEGTFNMCTFWLIECLARAGQVRKARLLFEKMLGYSNHLGLYAEELGPAGEQLGNFPQAFTHLALISAAYNLDRALDRHHME